MKQIVIAHQSEFTKRRSRVVHVDGVEIAVFQLSGGGYRAVENRCPHKNGKLSEGIVCDHHVFCPLHDMKINLNDGMAAEPDEGCVETYEVKLDETSGNVILYMQHKGIKAS